MTENASRSMTVKPHSELIGWAEQIRDRVPSMALEQSGYPTEYEWAALWEQAKDGHHLERHVGNLRLIVPYLRETVRQLEVNTAKWQSRSERRRDERNRYRSALERIESHGAGEAVRIARAALGEEWMSPVLLGDDHD